MDGRYRLRHESGAGLEFMNTMEPTDYNTQK